MTTRNSLPNIPNKREKVFRIGQVILPMCLGLLSVMSGCGPGGVRSPTPVWTMCGGNPARTFHGAPLALLSKPKVAWKRKALKKEDDPFLDVVADQKAIFILSWSEESMSPASRIPNYVVAVRISDGKELWKYEGKEIKGARDIVLDGEQILLAGWTGLFAIDRNTGRLLWRTKENWGKEQFPSGLVLDRARVYVSLPGEKVIDGKVVAFSRVDGKKIWQRSWSQLIKCLSLDRDHLVTVIGDGPDIVALNCKDGKTIWRRTLPPFSVLSHGELPAGVSGVPAIVDGKILVPTYCGKDWKILMARAVALDLDSGRVLWKANLPCEASTGIASDGKRVYMDALEEVVCLDLQTGRRLWKSKPAPKEPTGSARPYCLPVVISGQTLLVATSSGELFGLSAKTGKILWQVQLNNKMNISNRIMVSGGYVIVTNGPELCAFKPAAPAADKQK